ncbi:hypothetical protein NN561_017851 [Cricetulus griseus]
MQYCHENHIAHRDIKANNILLDCRGNAKLCDFGLATKVTQGQKLRDIWGILLYCAPEIFVEKAYDGCAVDIWSLGVLLFLMVVGLFTFQTISSEGVRCQIMAANFRIPEHVSIDIFNVIVEMLMINPDRRPTIDQIMRHPMTRDSKAHSQPMSTQKSPGTVSPGIVSTMTVMGYKSEEIIDSLRDQNYNQVDTITQEEDINEEVNITQEEAMNEKDTITEERTITQEKAITEKVTITQEEDITKQATITQEVSVTKGVTITKEEAITHEPTIILEEDMAREVTMTLEDTRTKEVTMADGVSMTQTESITEKETVIKHEDIIQETTITLEVTMAQLATLTQESTITQEEAITHGQPEDAGPASSGKRRCPSWKRVKKIMVNCLRHLFCCLLSAKRRQDSCKTLAPKKRDLAVTHRTRWGKYPSLFILFLLSFVTEDGCALLWQPCELKNLSLQKEQSQRMPSSVTSGMLSYNWTAQMLIRAGRAGNGVCFLLRLVADGTRSGSLRLPDLHPRRRRALSQAGPPRRGAPPACPHGTGELQVGRPEGKRQVGWPEGKSTG